MASTYLLSKNYVSADDTINVSSGSGTKTRIYDQRVDVQWLSVGETGETGYNTYVEVLFYEGTNAATRTYDTIILNNINLKKFKLQNYTGGSYADITGTDYTVNADTSLRIKLAAPVTGTKIKLLMWSTIVAAQEKKIGEFWVCLQSLELDSFRSASRDQNFLTYGDNYRLADGTLEQWDIYDKGEWFWNIFNLTQTKMESLRSIFQDHEVIVFYPDYANDLDEVYLAQLTGQWRCNHNPKTNLYAAQLEIKEQ